MKSSNSRKLLLEYTEIGVDVISFPFVFDLKYCWKWMDTKIDTQIKEFQRASEMKWTTEKLAKKEMKKQKKEDKEWIT